MADKFISLGGGNEIRASCHYLCCNRYNFLFDAGIKYEDRRRYPSFSEILKLKEIDSFEDINCIFSSRTHYDHNGGYHY